MTLRFILVLVATVLATALIVDRRTHEGQAVFRAAEAREEPATVPPDEPPFETSRSAENRDRRVPIVRRSEVRASVEPREGVRLRGTVRNSRGATLRGARVTLEAGRGPVRVFRSEVLSGSAGEFDFGDVPLVGRAGPPDWARLSANSNGAQRASSLPIRSLQPGDTYRLDLRLEDGGAISGTVLDFAGNPVADACVEVRLGGGEATDSTRTREDGFFLLAVPRSGTYRLFARSDRSGTADLELLLDAARNTTVPPVVLRAAQSIRGMVALPSGEPLGNAVVRARVLSGSAGNDCPPLEATTVTLEDGSFTFTGLHPGVYDLGLPGASVSLGQVVAPTEFVRRVADVCLIELLVVDGHGTPQRSSTVVFRRRPSGEDRWSRTTMSVSIGGEPHEFLTEPGAEVEARLLREEDRPGPSITMTTASGVLRRVLHAELVPGD